MREVCLRVESCNLRPDTAVFCFKKNVVSSSATQMTLGIQSPPRGRHQSNWLNFPRANSVSFFPSGTPVLTNAAMLALKKNC